MDCLPSGLRTTSSMYGSSVPGSVAPSRVSYSDALRKMRRISDDVGSTGVSARPATELSERNTPDPGSQLDAVKCDPACTRLCTARQVYFAAQAALGEAGVEVAGRGTQLKT